MTEDEDRRCPDRAIYAGANRVLTKPHAVDMLIREARELVDHARGLRDPTHATRSG